MTEPTQSGLELPGLTVEDLDNFKGCECTFEIQLAPRDLSLLTPTEIHRAYGWDVANYVIRLRAQVDMWRRMALRNAGESP